MSAAFRFRAASILPRVDGGGQGPGVAANDALLIGQGGLDALLGGEDNNTQEHAAAHDGNGGPGSGDDATGDAMMDLAAAVGDLSSIGNAATGEVVHLSATAAALLDLATGAAGDAAGDLFESIENLTGSAINDRLSGEDLASTLFGLAGDDRGGETGRDLSMDDAGVDARSGAAEIQSISNRYADDAIRVAPSQRTGWQAEADTFGSKIVIASHNAGEMFGDDSANVPAAWSSNASSATAAANITLDGDDAPDKSGQDDEPAAVGSAGPERLFGSPERFVFNSTADSTMVPSDGIVELTASHGDQIDVSMIDANAGAGGDQSFTFIGAAAFTADPGQLRYDGRNLEGDVDGNGMADFRVQLNVASLAPGDFVL